MGGRSPHYSCWDFSEVTRGFSHLSPGENQMASCAAPGATQSFAGITGIWMCAPWTCTTFGGKGWGKAAPFFWGTPSSVSDNEKTKSEGGLGVLSGVSPTPQATHPASRTPVGLSAGDSPTFATPAPKAIPEQLPVSSRLAPPLWSNPVWVGRPGVPTCLLLFPGPLAVCRCGALARRSPIRVQRTGMERGGEPPESRGARGKILGCVPGRQFPMKPSIEATPGDQPDLLCEFLPVVNGDWVLPGPGTSV